MQEIETSLSEILSTGKLGHLEVGIKREAVAELMPELLPPNGKDGWRFGLIEIFFQENVVWYYKIVPSWYEARFPTNVKVSGYLPNHTTTIREFINYLEVQNLDFLTLWNSWGNERWLVIFVEGKTEIRFTPESTLLAIGAFSEDEIQSHIQTEIAGNIALNIYDILRAYPDLGQVLKEPYAYQPASSQIFEPNDFRPDVSYMSFGREWVGNTIKGVPDLAVIVVRPHLETVKLKHEIRIYLSEGAKQVWLVYPMTKEVHVFSNENTEDARIYRGYEQIDANILFPNIQNLTPDTIFQLPKLTSSNINNQ